MTFDIPLNFGRTRVVDPCNMMTSVDFAYIAESNYDTILDDSFPSQVMYYFNLWHETMKQNRKCGQAYDFDAFMKFVQGDH